MMLLRGSRIFRTACAASTASPARCIARLAAPSALSRCFSSDYEGEMSDVLRFDCVYPESKTLTPRALRGRPVLVVNTASQCASATQLAALQQLYDQFHARGLEIIAVPSNDFDKKEPGSDAEITMRYTSSEGAFKVRFPIATKTTVVGADAHAFFDRIAKKYGRSVAPTWNFDKFLVDAYGDLCAVFPHDTDPLVPEVLEAIEDAIADMPTPSDGDSDSDSDSTDSDSDSASDSEDEDSDSDSDSDDEGSKKPKPTRR